jgi:signal transduction histidine kinase
MAQKESKPAFQIDWLLTNLRWLFIAGVAIVAALVPNRPLQATFAGLLIAAALYNLLILFWLALRAWSRRLVVLILALDLLFLLGFYLTYGGAQTPILFIGLLPILTAALRFGWLAGLGLGVVVAAEYVATAVATAPAPLTMESWLAVLLNVLVLLFLGVASVFVAQRMFALTRQTRWKEEEEELKRLRTARERAKIIYEMASTLSATLSYERVLETALDVVTMGLSELGPISSQIVGAVLLFQDDQLQVVTSRYMTPQDQQRAIPGRQGLVAQALEAAEAIIHDSVADDPELSQFASLRACQSIVVVPLRAGFENYGVLVYGSPVPNVFMPDHLELFTAVGNQAIIALQNARLYQNLLEEKERIITVDEDARKKLARDLHDGPTQSIAAIAMRLNFARRLLEREPARASEELRKIEELARRTTKEIREMLFTLRPLALETQGLLVALQQYFEKLRDTYDLNVILEAGPAVEEALDRNRQGVLFYIIEEAVNNARKHAQAKHIWTRLRIEGKTFVVEIEDDGVGFDLAAVDASYDQRGSLGMVNMRERAELINAALRIHSAPGAGTKITVLVPLEGHAALAAANLSAATGAPSERAR